MSKHTPGQAGPVRGKIGQTVFSSWRGIGVGRAAPKKSTKAASSDQVGQRSIFGIVTAFLSDVEEAINLGYPQNNLQMTARNLAVRYHLKNAVTGLSPNFALNFAEVKLTMGKLQTVDDVKAVRGEGNAINVTWLENTSLKASSSLEDHTNFYYYSTVKKRWIVFRNGPIRGGLTASMNIPSLFKGDKLHGYLFLTSVDGKVASKTEYLGLLTI